MLQPEDLIQDEIEHPDQTWQLQKSYTPSQADRRSLLRIRTRLFAQRSLQMSTNSREDELELEQFRTPFNEPFEQTSAGQFLQPPVAQPPRQKSMPVTSWRLVALIAALCVVILSSMWYALMHTPSLIGHPIQPRVTPVSVPHQNPLLISFKMTSALIGWGMGRSALDGSSSIVRTSDGGKTWQEFDFTGQPVGLLGYFFLDNQTAWVTVGSSLDVHARVIIMRTIDGGQHWTTLHMPPEMSNLTFLDQKHGWTWATGALPWGQESLALYKTVNGGMTWIKLGTLSTDRALDDLTPGPLPFNIGLDMTFLTPQHGWAIIYPSQNVQRALLYMTQDGGTTWQLQPLPQPATGPIPGIHTTIQRNSQSGAFVSMSAPKFFTPLHGVLSIVSQVKSQRPREIYLYETNNGGQSWSPLGTHLEDASGSQVPREVIDATHMLLSNTKTVSVYMLVNGQWQKQQTSQVVGQVMSLSFVNNQLGWVCAVQQSGNQAISTLYATSDGGKSWHEVMHVTTTPSQNQQGG